MTYNALITDLDGTAVPKGSDGSDISSATIDAIMAAKANGVRIACATGRSWHLVRPVVLRLGITDPCIVEGGTRIIDPTTGHTLWSQPLQPESVYKILRIFKARDDSGTLVYSDESVPQPLAVVDLESITEANFLYLLGLPASVAVSLAYELNRLADDFVAHITPSWKGDGYDDVHVTHRLADKEHAIKQWLVMMNLTTEDAVGMGDSGNDIPIFSAVGFKIAVGNATEDLKAVSDFVAPSKSEGALEYVMNNFF